MNIKELITAAGTREQAARIARVHRTTVYAWLVGKGRPDWLQFMALCRATKTDPMTVKDDPAESEPCVVNNQN